MTTKIILEETTTLSINIGEEPPPKVAPRIKAAPKIRQLYWCDFPKDAQLPEFWKCRSCLILSKNATLHGAVTILPCTSQPQPGNKWAYKQTTTIDGRADSWVICNYPTTLAVSRLSIDRSGTKFVPEKEFNLILALLHHYLPQPRLGS